MKKNTKGFTLIELLAVIVVLAIIALIATPIVLNLINDARRGAAEQTANAYVKAFETAVMTEMTKDATNTLCTNYEIKDKVATSKDTDCTIKSVTPSTTGTSNIKGSLTVSSTTGEVSKATLTVDDKFSNIEYKPTTGASTVTAS